jgi:DNA (cytosine-5)-methyltransferase 1
VHTISNIVKQKLTAIDLFCGCGGMSKGLQDAGFEILAGVDVEPNYICTFSYNFPNAKSLQIDLEKISPKLFMEMVGINRGEIDLLAGGPPCQGFSKNVPRKNRFSEDPRNKLIKVFLDYCEALQPRCIILENVAEMRNGFDQAYTDEILSRLEGYTITQMTLNAADYGIPQRRRRAFFIANRENVKFKLPTPTHSKDKNSLFAFPDYVTVWEAIGDLPSIEHTENEDISLEYSCKPFSDYQKLMRNGNKAVINHVARFLQPKQFERISLIEAGQGMKDLPEHLRTKGGYSGAYGRLTKEMVAPTITRWVFHPGSGRWGHPVDARLLTIREIARIQSFPDDFEFIGSYTQRAGQLGNAVPPLLAQKIAESMLAQVGMSKVASNSMNFSSSILSSDLGNLNAKA